MSVQREKSFVRDHIVNKFLKEHEEALKNMTPLIVQENMKVLKRKLIYEYCQQFVQLEFFFTLGCVCSCIFKELNTVYLKVVKSLLIFDFRISKTAELHALRGQIIANYISFKIILQQFPQVLQSCFLIGYINEEKSLKVNFQLIYNHNF